MFFCKYFLNDVFFVFEVKFLWTAIVDFEHVQKDRDIFIVDFLFVKSIFGKFKKRNEVLFLSTDLFFPIESCHCDKSGERKILFDWRKKKDEMFVLVLW